MKNRTMILASVVCCFIAASCSNVNKKGSDSSPVQAESIAEDSVCEDVAEPNDSNSIQVITRGGSASEGFGRCSKCNCKEFEGRGQICRNCGHAYKAHY